jgi:alkyl hydroperoxide reductase subunit AhpF
MLSFARALTPYWTFTTRVAATGVFTSSLHGVAGAADNDLGTSDQRESLHFDLLIVGAGPAGLSAAIRFKQVRRHVFIVLCTRQCSW